MMMLHVFAKRNVNKNAFLYCFVYALFLNRKNKQHSLQFHYDMCYSSEQLFFKNSLFEIIFVY